MYNNRIIEARKELNKLIKQSRMAGKRDGCALCGASPCAFCNSHSIPQFILRKIATNGYVYHPTAGVLNDDLSELEQIESGEFISAKKGVESSWTFHNICRKCDSVFFVDYESEDALKHPFTNRMMAEIALKNTLLQLDKRAIEVQMFTLAQKQNNNIRGKNILDEIQSLDIRDYEFEKRRAQKIIEKRLKSGYKLVYWKILPYTVPYALQSSIALQKDLNGRIINDLSNLSPNERTEDIHFVVFPLGGESVISVFYHKDDRKYVSFEKEFYRLSDDEKLRYINYTSIKYTENICATPSLERIVKDNTQLQRLITESSESPGFGFASIIEHLLYSPIKEEEIPNLLSETYSIEKIETK